MRYQQDDKRFFERMFSYDGGTFFGGRQIDLEDAEYHLMRGADPDEKFSNYLATGTRTVLFYATMAGKIDLCELLISYGANVDIDNGFGIGLLSVAVRSKILPLVEKYAGLVKNIDLWCEVRTGVPNPNDRGTPLHFAVRTDNIDIVKVLLEHGADPNVPTSFDCKIINSARTKEMIMLFESYGADNNHDRCAQKSGICGHCQYFYGENPGKLGPIACVSHEDFAYQLAFRTGYKRENRNVPNKTSENEDETSENETGEDKDEMSEDEDKDEHVKYGDESESEEDEEHLDSEEDT